MAKELDKILKIRNDLINYLKIGNPLIVAARNLFDMVEHKIDMPFAKPFVTSDYHLKLKVWVFLL